MNVTDYQRAELEKKLTLPKTTELYLSDIHGEYAAFSHVLRGACGLIRQTIAKRFGSTLSEAEQNDLATLIYYPEQKLPLLEAAQPHKASWFAQTLLRLVALYSYYAEFYLPGEVKERVLPEHISAISKFSTTCSKPQETTIALCKGIKALAVEHLHLVGDVYDRGPHPDLIMDELAKYPSFDIQWGNHDIVWMGASLGQPGCIANVVRICARYGNLDILEDTYGIDLSVLSNFALSAYKDDPCVAFGLKGNAPLSPKDKERAIKVQKAMAILQFKVEAQLIAENPSFGLEDRNLLDKIDYQKNTVVIDGIEHEILDTVFPTVDPENPYQLTPEEEAVVSSLIKEFTQCKRLQKHMAIFLNKGSLYKIVNNNLLFHACVPLNSDGSLKEVTLFGKTYKGKTLFDAVDSYVRSAFTNENPDQHKQGLDLIWYLWLGEGSPLFAKSKMATFELYYVADKQAQKEQKNAFYTLYENPEIVATIFEEFGMDPKNSRIICGHTPVKVKDGEDPVKGGGCVVVIDGGMSDAYQSTTGIAGFTLIHNDKGVILATLEPLESTQAAIFTNADIHPEYRWLYKPEKPITVAQTDLGKEIEEYLATID